MTKRFLTPFLTVSIFLSGLLLFTVGLSHQEIIGFESRFYLFVLEMWRHGTSWFPTTYHEPYPDYPGTGTILIYAFAKCVGHLDKFTAVFPSACASAMTLCVTYWIGALRSQRWGLSAVCFLLLTHAFVQEARTISLDQYTTLVTALCFYFAVKQKKIWIFPLLVLGFSVRGPIGLVIPTGVLCFYYLLEKDFKSFLLITLGATFLMIVCSAVLLWMAYHSNGVLFVWKVMQKQVLGRMNDARPLPFRFYFIESLGAYALAYPLAILVAIGIWRSSQRKFLLQLLAWAAVILIGLSIPTDKKVRYILPMTPALALLCGYLFTEAQQTYFVILRRIIFYFCSVLPSLCLVGLGIIFWKQPQFPLAYAGLAVFFVVMQIACLCLRKKDLVVLFLASFTFVSAYIFIAEPINLTLNKTRAFVLEVEELREKHHAQLVFYREGTDGLVIKYIVNMPKDSDPVFLVHAEELLAFSKPAIFMATQENFNELPKEIAQRFQIKMQGNLGREPFVVFLKR